MLSRQALYKLETRFFQKPQVMSQKVLPRTSDKVRGQHLEAERCALNLTSKKLAVLALNCFKGYST